MNPETVLAAAERAIRAIPPAWPLSATVAVNPYLGQTEMTLAETGALLGKVAGATVTMPRPWYAARIADGRIAEADLEGALAAHKGPDAPADVAALRARAASSRARPEAVPTLADLAADVSDTDWPGLVTERVGAWCAGYFDEGQALWAAPKHRGAWDAWRQASRVDLTPEIAGLSGFGQFAVDAHRNPAKAMTQSVEALGLEEAALDAYFHRLLLTLGGWAQAARYRLWQAELAGGTDATGTDLLAIRLKWEEALHRRFRKDLAEDWAEARAAYAAPARPDADMVADAILQEAAERAGQRALAATLDAPAQAAADGRPEMQAAFCIDVRSEVFRRALEATDPSVRTLGFAGFFGIGASHRGFASDAPEHRLPVLLNAGLSSVSGPETEAAASDDQTARFRARAERAWGRFKLAAVSSFAFVEAMGPVYVGKLLRDALSLPHDGPTPEPAPRLDPLPPLEARVDAAATVLRAMSLTEDFARLVLILGHGARVTNDPFGSALQCGACGGFSGEVNARLLAGLLNEPAVREALPSRGLDLPADTLFVAGLHDTVTDEITLYTGDVDTGAHGEDLARARDRLATAGAAARAERAPRLPGATGDTIAARATDWAETRSEWGLAGCRAFLAAPRSRSAGRSLDGRTFLHDYDWRRDEGFGVLELILTAPVVVASWISLQYYGSTVSPALWGSGDKLLHNVVGGIGVVEGNGGTMRAGLSWQSVHDGDDFVHEPLRLTVCVEAPREAMADILERHPGVRALFDKGWLHLFALDETGRMRWRYGGDLTWIDQHESTASAEAEAA